MSVLVFAHHNNGSFPKGVIEACSYAKKMGGPVTAVTYGSPSDSEIARLGEYGVDKVLKSSSLSDPDAGQMSRLVAGAADQLGAQTIICSMDLIGKAVAPRVSARLKAGLVSGASALPEGDGTIRTAVFSGKAYSHEEVKSAQKVINLTPNSVMPEPASASASVEEFSTETGDKKVTVKEVKKREGDISLPDAELVVSAGRGLKGPENWGMVEEMAGLLGAATACSRPVADIGWRPHHEHVGQTGVAIRPNLYIAIGISGAIQHLAGVNQSKVMVVVNTDPEAPFFKAADYGIVGDAFDVIPKLNAAIKEFKG